MHRLDINTLEHRIQERDLTITSEQSPKKICKIH